MTGLLFGTFDGLHDGHKAMLIEARKYAERIVVALPPDGLVAQLKGHAPRHSWQERHDALLASGLVDHVCTGDKEPGMYTVIADEAPDVILIGYDQDALHDSLKAFLATYHLAIPIIVLSSFHPELYKSSLLPKV